MLCAFKFLFRSRLEVIEFFSCVNLLKYNLFNINNHSYKFKTLIIQKNSKHLLLHIEKYLYQLKIVLYKLPIRKYKHKYDASVTYE